MRLAVLGAVAVALAGCASPPTGDQDEEEDRSFPIHGSATTRYRARWTGEDRDHDVTQLLSLEVGDRKEGKVSGYVLAEALADLDGRPEGGGASPFHELADTYDDALTGRLYHAYADLRVARELDTFRVGRQADAETPETAYFDGVRLGSGEIGRARARFGGFGGLPVRIHESHESGEAMFGLFGEARPWKGGRLRLDWMHVEDEGLFGPRDDDLLGARASHGFGKGLRLDAETTRLGDEPRDVRARASAYVPDADLVVQASWYRLLETQGDLTIPFDPFFATLFELHPYRQVGLLASKGFGDHVDVQGGFDLRRVEDQADVGEFNRDFDRAFVTVGLRDSLPADLDASVTGEVWDASGSQIETIGADLSRAFGEALEAALGTYYSLFKYDLFQDRELDRVRTWFCRLDWKRSASSRFDLRYEFEDGEDDEYHSIRLGATWRF